MRPLHVSFVLALALLQLSRPARAAGYDELGTLERGAVEVALAQRGLVIEPEPADKTVGAVHVVNLDVFQPEEGRLLGWFNHFHRTTRESHIRRESLLLSGMSYDAALVAETVRTLRNRNSYSTRDPTWSSIVAMVPVKGAAPGVVDVLIVTRDVWSLRLNSDYNYQPGYLITLNISVSENNLLGWRKQAAVEFIMRQGDMWLGPTYFDPNVLGTRWRLTSAVYAGWAREIGQLAAGSREGFSDWQRLEYPFYALAQRWGGFVEGTYTSNVVRMISGTGGTPVAVLTTFDPTLAPAQCIVPHGATAASSPGATPAAECAYRSRVGSITSGLTRSFPGSRLVQRLTVGNEIGLVRASFLPDFPSELRDAFARRYFRISERTSGLYVQYEAFTPRYRVYRDLDRYDLAEDMRLGPSFTVRFGRASTWLGSEADFFRVKAEAQLNLGLLGGFQTLRASWETREAGAELHDQLLKAQVYAATGVLARSLRLVVGGVAGVVAGNVHRAQVYVGGLEGLRGYPVNAFLGYDWYVAHVELRSLALALGSLRMGAIVFGDAGHAADTLGQLSFYGDAGVGLRLLVPQLDVDLLRCDWAFPLRAAAQVQAGWPGRLSCGLRQAF